MIMDNNGGLSILHDQSIQSVKTSPFYLEQSLPVVPFFHVYSDNYLSKIKQKVTGTSSSVTYVQ